MFATITKLISLEIGVGVAQGQAIHHNRAPSGTFNVSADLLGTNSTPAIWQRLKSQQQVQDGTILGVQLSHDAAFAVTKEGSILVVLELERLMSVRYELHFVPCACYCRPRVQKNRV